MLLRCEDLDEEKVLHKPHVMMNLLNSTVTFHQLSLENNEYSIYMFRLSIDKFMFWILAVTRFGSTSGPDKPIV